MKLVVFLMRHNRKDKRYKDLAYIQTFIDIMSPIILLLIMLLFSLEIEHILNAQSNIGLGLKFALYIFFPLGILFYIFYSPQKIINNYRKYTYSKHYIWYLRAIYIGILIIFILSAILRQQT